MSGFVDAITYWAPSTLNEYNERVYTTPAARTGRWEQCDETFIDSKGREQKATDIVYLQQAVALEGYLLFGTSASTVPKTVSGAKEVKAVQRVANIRGNKVLFKVWM